jgi:hypothetical protein
MTCKLKVDTVALERVKSRGHLYQFWVMAAVCALALPVIWSLRQDAVARTRG